MKILKIIVLLLLAGCRALESEAQTVKPITVRQGGAFTDHISLESDTKDMDIMVKFVFNEDSNQLAVSLISYRTLFVFWANTPYKPVIRGRRIKPDMLPYEATFDPAAKYMLSKNFKRSVPKPRKKYVFKRWVEYDGLQPVPQEYKILSDYVEQVFDITNKRTNVMVRLRNLMLMDKNVNKKKPVYEVTYGKDLNLEYQVTIERNPCSGMEEDLAAAQNVLNMIKDSYADIQKRFGSGKTTNPQKHTAFEQMKELLLTQHVRKNVASPCPDIQATWEKYNCYVDSIQAMTSTLIADNSAKGEMKMQQAKLLEVPAPKMLMSCARQLDVAVSRWLFTKDPIERSDIERQCQAIIKNVEDAIEKGSVSSPGQQKALKIFRSAERYYRNTCGKK